MKYFLPALFILSANFLFTIAAPAQNIFPNAGFEDLNICTEYAAPCAPEAWFYIKPTNNPLVTGSIAPRPINGKNLLLVPLGNVYKPFQQRPFVYTMLTCALQKGNRYKLAFYINTVGRPFYNIDFYFSPIEPASIGFETDSLQPDISLGPNDIQASLKQGWQYVERIFTATSNARFCLIGNMAKEPVPFSVKDVMSTSGNIYHFVDEVSLLPIGQTGQCDDYTLNLQKAYAQNHRHTDFALVDTVPPIAEVPVFTTDTITVPAAFFETNKAILKPGFTQLMDSIFNRAVHKNIFKIQITGHTDNRGTPQKNNVLSLDRATAVARYIEQRWLQYKTLISTEGKGQEQPVADNTTERGRSLNRRVEIIITFEQKRDR